MLDLFFFVAWIISGIGTLLLGAVAVTYIRRTWQLIRAEEDDPTRERLLDGLDHLENQMHHVGRRLGDLEEKLDGIERGLGAGDAPAELTARSQDSGTDTDTDTEGRDER